MDLGGARMFKHRGAFITCCSVVCTWLQGKGMFAEHPTEGDRSLKVMYEKLNERTVAALVDHDWISMAKEQSQW